MKSIKWMIALLGLGLVALVANGSAWADGRGHHRHHHRHSGVHLGIVLGSPVWDPWPYHRPYYPPQVVIVPAEPPPVYIEQASPSLPDSAYWYYCDSARAYYPYVKDCPGGWQKVVPQAPEQ